MQLVNLSELAKVAAGESISLRPIIEKEIIHYDILAVMSKKEYLPQLTFQGGTSLRLCYNSERLSEDLDFTGGTEFNESAMGELKQDIEDYLHAKYGLAVTVKAPKEVNSNEGVQVSAWQVSVETQPEDKSVPRQRIKVEVANVPSYTSQARLIRNNYPDLPVDEVLVKVQSMDEIMADKLLAFPVAKNIRYRDIWDLRFMAARGARPDIGMLKSKIEDYGIIGYQDALTARMEQLKAIINSDDFIAQMSRFLPMSTISKQVSNADFKESTFHVVNDLFVEVSNSFNPPKPRSI